jgi:hypothetical protein
MIVCTLAAAAPLAGQPLKSSCTSVGSSLVATLGRGTNGYESLTLPYAIDPSVPHTLTARFTIALDRDIGPHELVDSGDLDPGVRERMPTFTLHGAAVERRPDETTPHSLLPDELACPRP